MFIADAFDDDSDPDVSMARHPHMLRGVEAPEMGLACVAPFIEMNPDNVASTMEWRGRVLHPQ